MRYGIIVLARGDELTYDGSGPLPQGEARRRFKELANDPQTSANFDRIELIASDNGKERQRKLRIQGSDTEQDDEPGLIDKPEPKKPIARPVAKKRGR